MKTAFMEFSCEVLPDVLPVLRDYGLVVVGSSISFRPETVRLVMGETSDGLLPAECEHYAPFVKAMFTQETYGRQRMAKVSSIEVWDDPERPE